LLDAEPHELPELQPSALAIIIAILKNEHAWAIIDGGSDLKAHDLMLRLASCGIANLTSDLDTLAEALKSLFPLGYDGDTKEQILEMLTSAARKRLGASSKNEEQSIASIAVERASQGADLFHDFRDRAYLSARTAAGGVANLRLDTEEAKNFIRRQYFAEFKKPLHSNPLQQAIETLRARALYDGPKQAVAVRIARQDNTIYVDLGRQDHLLVHFSSGNCCSSRYALTSSPLRLLIVQEYVSVRHRPIFSCQRRIKSAKVVAEVLKHCRIETDYRYEGLSSATVLGWRAQLRQSVEYVKELQAEMEALEVLRSRGCSPKEIRKNILIGLMSDIDFLCEGLIA
jgi:hypothetical protein